MIETIFLMTWIHTLKNRFLENPGGSLFRLFIAALFLGGILWFALFLGEKLSLFLIQTSLLSPTVAANVFGHILHRLLLPLFPLLVLSQAISSLAILFGDREMLFYHTHPVKPFLFLRMTGLKIYLTTTGYIYLLCFPLLLKLGGRPYLLKGTLWISLFLLTSWGLGVTLTIGLASVFRVSTLNRLFGFFLALTGASFVVMFRKLRPEHLFTSPGDLILSLGGPPNFSCTPPGWTARLLSFSYFGLPTGQAIFRLSLFALFSVILTAVVHKNYYIFAWRKSAEVSGVRKRLAPKIPSLSPLFTLTMKEFLSLVRNPTRFSQLALMAALMILYLYNLYLLKGMGVAALHPLIMTFHVGMTGFILSALGVRFAFPAPSLDGGAFWFLAVHPVSRIRVETGRALCYGLGFSILSLFLTFAVGILCKVPLSMLLPCCLVLLLLSLLLAFSAVLMGNLHPRRHLQNPLQIGFSPEGLAYFGVALGFTSAASAGCWHFL